MLERARTLELDGVRFTSGDIGDWEPDAPFDVCFSNAALQWVGDHPTLFARLSAMLTPGGELAVQVPANFDHVSHTLAADIAREEPFAAAMNGYTRTFSVLPPEGYAALLHDLGFLAQSVRLQVYGHVLDSPDAVVERVRGTLLTDYELRLPEPLYQEFVARYGLASHAALGDQRPYFYPFKRILLWGRRPAGLKDRSERSTCVEIKRLDLGHLYVTARPVARARVRDPARATRRGAGGTPDAEDPTRCSAITQRQTARSPMRSATMASPPAT